MTPPRLWIATTIAGLVTGLIAATPMSLAQAPQKLALIAILEPGPAARPTAGLATMREALAELGWVEGRTVRFETRYADWQPPRMVELARELVLLKPDVVYTHSTPAVQAAMQATTSIPIVVGLAADLLGMGAVKSLAKPGGNVTGMTGAMHELDHKRLEVLKEAVPSVSRIADRVSGRSRYFENSRTQRAYSVCVYSASPCVSPAGLSQRSARW
jgi:putative ABC transport system substrate-binding protein